jgi:aspartate 1-decarboxylase
MVPARRVQKDDIIIISYASMEFEEAKPLSLGFFPNENDNSLT